MPVDHSAKREDTGIRQRGRLIRIGCLEFDTGKVQFLDSKSPLHGKEIDPTASIRSAHAAFERPIHADSAFRTDAVGSRSGLMYSKETGHRDFHGSAYKSLPAKGRQMVGKTGAETSDGPSQGKHSLRLLRRESSAPRQSIKVRILRDGVR
jgi:hypothetical protein